MTAFIFVNKITGQRITVHEEDLAEAREAMKRIMRSHFVGTSEADWVRSAK